MHDEEEDWRDDLSPESRAIVDQISLRKHGVGLERVQRIHLGIDTEPMEFSTETLADMLQDIANECSENEAFVLHAFVRALTGQDKHHRLELKQKKPGRWESPTEHEARHNRKMSWLYSLAYYEIEGMKTEAAIARIAELAGVSRASVFSAIKDAEKFLDTCRSLFPDEPVPDHLKNPRPAKRRDD